MITMGASEIATALGLGRTKEDGEPYVSQRELWLRLTGRIERYENDPDNVDAELGRWGEAAVLNRYMAENGNGHIDLSFVGGPGLESPPLRCDRWPLFHARPDMTRKVMVPGHGLTVVPIEAKNPRELADDRWGPTGTDQMPDEYLVQVITQVAVMDAPFGILCAMARAPRTNKRTWVVYRYDRDVDLERRVLGGAREWYERHVVANVEPPVDGSESCSMALGRQWRPKPGSKRYATSEIESTVLRLRQVREAVRQQESHEALLVQEVKQFMGEAEVLVGVSGTLATWREGRGGKRHFRILEAR